MHGTIEVKSKLGEGSTFTVRIPCRISSREETEPTAFDETAAQTLSGCRILLAEDNDLNAEISIELLTREGLLVERANDGVACLEMLQKAPEDYYDLILMDIQIRSWTATRQRGRSGGFRIRRRLAFRSLR